MIPSPTAVTGWVDLFYSTVKHENDFNYTIGFLESFSFLSLPQTSPLPCRAGHRFHFAPIFLELFTLEGLE